ncbi:hypothetical protein LLE49_06880 [Alicyclobacillus tolerans]|uniref:hypothetical protein n=1 Tax=Alicyclobacillus tolerans TaxID=90970 RepID=UPI001F49029E|nr:hypothetical protein [Alicyclobacillus tolerans]MCF8564470.1 hypothetical protein [Alicyclobacillus tolerans]
MNERIAQHLEQAWSHLEEALNLSVQNVSEDAGRKGYVSELWSAFLGRFMDAVRVKSKESRMNLMTWISFAKAKR